MLGRGKGGDVSDHRDTEAAWAYCPSSSSGAPLELIKVTESNDYPEREAAFGEEWAPMDGTWLTFSGVTGLWEEKRGGNFWGYGSAYEFAEDVFCFDPLLGKRLLCDEGVGREFWPVEVSDVEVLEEMGISWQESLARCVAAVPSWRRGDSLLCVPELLRIDFGRWCCELDDSGVFENGPLMGTSAFRAVVRECAAHVRRIPWARAGC